MRDGEAVSHVLLFATLGAVRREHVTRRLSRRDGSARVEPEPGPAEVATGRATVVSVREPFADEAAARRWLRSAGEPELAEDLAVLGRALHAYRVVSADPYLQPVGRWQVLVARVGYGAGEEVAEGRWSDARELAARPARARRSRALDPQVRLAGVLGGHVPLLVCEELALRARLDLDHGRPRVAAVQLLAALDAALAELPAEPGGEPGGEFADRVGELATRRPEVADAAETALTSTPSAAQQDAVAATLGRLEAALRARALART